MMDLNTGNEIDWDPNSEDHKKKVAEAYVADKVAHEKKKEWYRAKQKASGIIEPPPGKVESIEESFSRRHPGFTLWVPPPKRRAIPGKSGVPTVEIYIDGKLVFEPFDPLKHGDKWEL